MANSEHLAVLAQGAPAFNQWRQENPGLTPDLSGADLSSASLNQVNLRGAVLSGADLEWTHLQEADLREATLVGANLQGAFLGGADLRGVKGSWLAFNQEGGSWVDRHGGASSHGVNFQGAHLEEADLRGADLREADFCGAFLVGADLRTADLRSANLEQANVTGVKFSQDCRQRAFFGTRLSTCYGSQMFKSYAEGQIFLEEYRRAHPGWFWLWWLTSDCGHSLLRWAGWSACFALVFGLIFFMMGTEHFKAENLPFTLPTMLYFSGVTFTTLGFGDINPRTETAAGLVMLEVVLGYIMLGGLISILAIKLSRRG
ncbi:MAG: pentapeptide repeat-containing protein [Desulfarculus sp.]|nr:pentapeptide repeat-containing protein [Desulfarculus sp.]